MQETNASIISNENAVSNDTQVTMTSELDLQKATDDKLLMKPNMKMLYCYTACLAISGILSGFSYAGNVQTAPLFIEKFGWSPDDAKLYNTLISLSSILGIFVGSFAGDSIIKHGRRKGAWIMDIIAMCGQSICQAPYVPAICIGRFCGGFVVGVLNNVMMKSLYETVPNDKYPQFAALSNVCNQFGLCVALLTGLILPDPSEYATSESWRIIYAFPILFGLVQLILWLTVFKYEPINFLIDKITPEADKEAKKFIAMCYIFPDSYKTEEEKEECLNNYIYIKRTTRPKPRVISMKEVLFSPKYAIATWMGIGVCVFQQLSGQNSINTSMKRLFSSFGTSDSALKPIYGTYIIGVLSFIFSVVGAFTITKVGRRTMFIIT